MAILIEQLVDHIIDTKYDSFNSEVIEAAKKRLIDVAGCAIGGANASGNNALLEIIRRWKGNKEATILVHGDKVPLPFAAMVNCMMVRSFDYEVIGPSPEGENAGRMVGHVSSTTEGTALSVAEYKGLTGKDIISAIILGADLAARISVAQDFEFDSSFEVCGTVNAFGATAVAGKMYGLSKEQMINAFGILVNQMGGSFQTIWDGVHSFKLIGAQAAMNGIFSVELAGKGFTGLKDPLLSPQGYFPQYCKKYHPEYAVRDLGKVFYCKGQHKMHPSCYGNHTAIDCSLEILEKYNVNVDAISEINLMIHPSRGHSFLNQPFNREDLQPKALFNLPYGVASVLLRKSAKLEHYTDEFIHDPRVIEMVSKVKLIPTFQGKSPRHCQLIIVMQNGETYSAEREEPRGWLNQITKEEVKEKFRKNVAFSKTISIKKADEALELLDNIEQVENVNKIIELLVV